MSEEKKLGEQILLLNEKISELEKEVKRLANNENIIMLELYPNDPDISRLAELEEKLDTKVDIMPDGINWRIFTEYNEVQDKRIEKLENENTILKEMHNWDGKITEEEKHEYQDINLWNYFKEQIAELKEVLQEVMDRLDLDFEDLFDKLSGGDSKLTYCKHGTPSDVHCMKCLDEIGGEKTVETSTVDVSEGCTGSTPVPNEGFAPREASTDSKPPECEFYDMNADYCTKYDLRSNWRQKDEKPPEQTEKMCKNWNYTDKSCVSSGKFTFPYDVVVKREDLKWLYYHVADEYTYDGKLDKIKEKYLGGEKE